MSGMGLFRRKSSSQALIQAPSADLIESDKGPKLPEPAEIPCQMTAEEFESYMKNINFAKNRNSFLTEEGLRQALRVLGYKNYPGPEVGGFLKKQAGDLRRTDTVIGWPIRGWNPYSRYSSPIPPRVINGIKDIESHPYSPADIYFYISDLLSANNGFSHHPRHNTEICFLGISLRQCSYDSTMPFIIDAWRGPTFSDEEARI